MFDASFLVKLKATNPQSAPSYPAVVSGEIIEDINGEAMEVSKTFQTSYMVYETKVEVKFSAYFPYKLTMQGAAAVDFPITFKKGVRFDSANGMAPQLVDGGGPIFKIDTTGTNAEVVASLSATLHASIKACLCVTGSGICACTELKINGADIFGLQATVGGKNVALPKPAKSCAKKIDASKGGTFVGYSKAPTMSLHFSAPEGCGFHKELWKTTLGSNQCMAV